MRVSLRNVHCTCKFHLVVGSSRNSGSDQVAHGLVERSNTI